MTNPADHGDRVHSGVWARDEKPQLILFDSDAALLERLSGFSQELPYISFEVGYGPQVAARAHLDAFWATLMVGVELFGAVPPFPVHEAQVLKTPQKQLQQGFPRYGVIGVAVASDDPTAPEFNLRLVLSSLLKAIKEFNSRSPDRITRVGILPDNLELRKLDPANAFKIVRQVFEQDD